MRLPILILVWVRVSAYLTVYQNVNKNWSEMYGCVPKKLTSQKQCLIENMSFILINGPRQANLVLIAYASSEGSGEPVHPCSLARTSAAPSYKQWVKRNLETESQIPGPFKICHDGMLEDTNSLDAAQIQSLTVLKCIKTINKHTSLHQLTVYSKYIGTEKPLRSVCSITK